MSNPYLLMAVSIAIGLILGMIIDYFTSNPS